MAPPRLDRRRQKRSKRSSRPQETIVIDSDSDLGTDVETRPSRLEVIDLTQDFDVSSYDPDEPNKNQRRSSHDDPIANSAGTSSSSFRHVAETPSSTAPASHRKSNSSSSKTSSSALKSDGSVVLQRILDRLKSRPSSHSRAHIQTLWRRGHLDELLTARGSQRERHFEACFPSKDWPHDLRLEIVSTTDLVLISSRHL